MNPQQQLINGMLNKANLLNMLRTATVFMDTDAGPRIKVVCRYQQFRAANKIVQRLRDGNNAEERSGVVWHTQGSGKSLTMVFVARLLRAASDLSDYKIVLINDRVDLEDQLGKTATLIGGRVNAIESRKALRTELASDSSDINMVMVHKFQTCDEAMPLKVAEALGTYQAIPTAKTFGEVNASERIVLMIDEAHRTQGSDLGDNIFEAFPNAARIAFTGTPLITERHGEKKTYKRFGSYIDEYRLMDAVEDGTTLQILYEGRTADAALNDKHGFETQFENLFKDRTEAELLAIKKKYGATGDLLEAEKRIEAIAKDLVKHYLENIFPNGFKAQVVCHSKLAAVRYQRLLQLFSSNKVSNIKAFVQGKLPSVEADAQVVHEAVKLLKNEKIRADFEVYLKKFLMSMDIILPHPAAQPYRIPAKRFGYILRVTKERYKDTSLNLGDAGQKVKDLINEHLISLGINPKVPPVELLSATFIDSLNQH